MDENRIRPTHPELVKALAKPGADICATLDPSGAHWLHMAVGIAGEAGELLDAVKKAVIYNKPLDRENVIEELGDLEFYLEGLRDSLGITREQCLEANIDKLGKRYAAGTYSDKAAQDRADKAPGAERKFFGSEAVLLAADEAPAEPAFLVRLRAEQQDLAERHEKLELFLVTPAFGELSLTDQGLLEKQANQQHNLLQTLNQRINSITGSFSSGVKHG